MGTADEINYIHHRGTSKTFNNSFNNWDSNCMWTTRIVNGWHLILKTGNGLLVAAFMISGKLYLKSKLLWTKLEQVDQCIFKSRIKSTVSQLIHQDFTPNWASCDSHLLRELSHIKTWKFCQVTILQQTGSYCTVWLNIQSDYRDDR